MYDIQDDFKRIRFTPDLRGKKIPLLQSLTALGYSSQKTGKPIVTQKYSIPGFSGDIRIETFSPRQASGALPCLLYIHGGAFVLGAAPHHKKAVCDYSLGAQCTVVVVHYSLAPQHPYPAAQEDCYSTYSWIYREAEALGINKNKIGIGGDSAGAFLAANLLQMILDRRNEKAALQMLIYPVIDPDMTTPSMKRFDDTPVWNSKVNRRMWELYLPKHHNSDGLEYCNPLKNRLEDMPPAYVETAEFDCLHDEGILYYEKLKSRGISAVLNETRGTIHGYEVRYDCSVTRENISRRIRFLSENLN